MPLLENDQSGTVILKTPSGLILHCIFFPQYNFFVLFFLYIYNIGILLKPRSCRFQENDTSSYKSLWRGSLPCYVAPAGFTRKGYNNPMGAQQCGVAELDFDFRVSLYLGRTQHDTDCCRSQETNDILG